MTDEEFQRELAEAEAGSGVSQAYLGGLLLYGAGVPTDHQLAAKLLTMAHKQGVLVGTVGLGQIYLNGWGVAKRTPQAVVYLLDAAARGHLPSLLDLARIFAIGDGLPADAEQAALYYTRLFTATSQHEDWNGGDEWKEARYYLDNRGLL